MLRSTSYAGRRPFHVPLTCRSARGADVDQQGERGQGAGLSRFFSARDDAGSALQRAACPFRSCPLATHRSKPSLTVAANHGGYTTLLPHLPGHRRAGAAGGLAVVSCTTRLLPPVSIDAQKNTSASRVHSSETFTLKHECPGEQENHKLLSAKNWRLV